MLIRGFLHHPLISFFFKQLFFLLFIPSTFKSQLVHENFLFSFSCFFLLFFLSTRVASREDIIQHYMPGTIIYRKQKADEERKTTWTVFCQFSVPSFAIEILCSFFFVRLLRLMYVTFQEKRVSGRMIFQWQENVTHAHVMFVWRKPTKIWEKKEDKKKTKQRTTESLHRIFAHTFAHIYVKLLNKSERRWGKKGGDGNISDAITLSICSDNLHLIIMKKYNFHAFFRFYILYIIIIIATAACLLACCYFCSKPPSYDWRIVYFFVLLKYSNMSLCVWLRIFDSCD